MSKKTVKVVAVDEYTADIYLDGERVGEAADCDTLGWIVTCDDSEVDELLGGCYPAKDAASLAYAINECVAGVTVEGVV